MCYEEMYIFCALEDLSNYWEAWHMPRNKWWMLTTYAFMQTFKMRLPSPWSTSCLDQSLNIHHFHLSLISCRVNWEVHDFMSKVLEDSSDKVGFKVSRPQDNAILIPEAEHVKCTCSFLLSFPLTVYFPLRKSGSRKWEDISCFLFTGGGKHSGSLQLTDPKNCCLGDQAPCYYQIIAEKP